MHVYNCKFLLGILFLHFFGSVHHAVAVKDKKWPAKNRPMHRNEVFSDRKHLITTKRDKDDPTNSLSNAQNSNGGVEDQFTSSGEGIQDSSSHFHSILSIPKRDIFLNPDLHNLLPMPKLKTVEAYEDAPPIKSNWGELVYPSVKYHKISAYQFSKDVCKNIPAIPLHISPKLKQRNDARSSYSNAQHLTELQRMEFATSCTVSDDSTDDLYHGPESYVFVTNPDFDLAYNNPYAYIPDTNPTAYLSLVDLVSRVGLRGVDDGDFPDIVPWPEVDLNRMVNIYRSTRFAFPGAADRENLVKTLKLKAEESGEIKRLLRRVTRSTDEKMPPNLRELTGECGAISNATDCANGRKGREQFSCYCGGTTATGVRCCDFQGKAGTYRSFPGDETVFITNAKPITIESPFLSLSKIFIHNSKIAEVEGTIDSSSYKRINLHVSNSNAAILPPFEIISLFNSQISTISAPCELRKISIYQSVITMMQNLKVVDNFPVTIYHSKEKIEIRDVGFRAETSKIHYFNNVTLNCPAVMYSCTVERISSVKAKQMYISGSNIRTVHPFGLDADETLSLVNTKISHLHRSAIVLPDDGLLTMKNVIIEHCDKPCFQMHPDTKLILENVWLNDKKLKDQKNVENDLLSRSHRKLFSASSMMNICNVVHFHWICDMFTYAETPLDLVLRRDAFEYLTVQNHPNIAIQEGCFRNVTLKNINGFFYSSKPSGADPSHTGCLLPSLMELKNSNLTTLFSRRVGEIRATEGYSSVQYLDLGSVTCFQAANLSIGIVEHLELRPGHPRWTSFITDTVIRYIRDFIINAPVTFSRVHIFGVQNLVISHFSDAELPTTMQSTNFTNVPVTGIRVLSGKLMLLNVRFQNPEENMLYLADRTQLLIQGDVTDSPLNCSQTGPIISAVSRKQVLYLNAITPDWLWDCVSFYKPPGDRGASHAPDVITDTKIIDPNIDCRSDGRDRLLCEFEHIAAEVQLGGNNALDYYKTVTVKEANLTIAHHCLQEIVLDYVNNDRTIGQHESCFYKLRMTNTKMASVVGRVLELHMRLSYVSLINLNEIHLFKLKYSQFNEIKATVNNGTWYRANINIVRRLVVTNDLAIERSKLAEFLDSSIIVMPNATLAVSDTVMSRVEASAIYVFGKLILSNVSISRAYSGSILVSEEGEVTITRLNVTQCITSANHSYDTQYGVSSKEKQAVTSLTATYTYDEMDPLPNDCDFLQTYDGDVTSLLVDDSFETTDSSEQVETEAPADVEKVIEPRPYATKILIAVLATTCIFITFGFISCIVWRRTPLSRHRMLLDQWMAHRAARFEQNSFNEPENDFLGVIQVDELEPEAEVIIHNVPLGDNRVPDQKQESLVRVASESEPLLSRHQQKEDDSLHSLEETEFATEVFVPPSQISSESSLENADLQNQEETSSDLNFSGKEATAHQDTSQSSEECHISAATYAILKRKKFAP